MRFKKKYRPQTFGIKKDSRFLSTMRIQESFFYLKFEIITKYIHIFIKICYVPA